MINFSAFQEKDGTRWLRRRRRRRKEKRDFRISFREIVCIKFSELRIQNRLVFI